MLTFCYLCYVELTGKLQMLDFLKHTRNVRANISSYDHDTDLDPPEKVDHIATFASFLYTYVIF